ncbi:MAG: DivIVA domain-containing protein [Oscillospiraceae bacterium]|nr:DivIVA domain-containing protein [Oscillospiraceae bacterium]
MLTPQEVAERSFAKASFGGYNMAMVDEFLDLLTTDYTTLYKENSTLKSKMKVLAEKVEEYRSTEDAMRKTLLTAQKMADDLLAEAESRKAELMGKAEEEARVQLDKLRQDIENERGRLAAAQHSVNAYVGKLKGLYQHEYEYLSNLGSMTVPQSAAKEDAAVDEAVKDIEDTVKRMVEDIPAQEPDRDDTLIGVSAKGGAPSEPQLSASAKARRMEDTSPTRRIDFDHLQFGKDYEIT